MSTQIRLGDIAIDVVKKDIKNVHLSVYPPTGKVRISAPLDMDINAIRVFAISKLGWVKQQQKKLCGQERETPREYVDRESHYVWGKRYLLKVTENDSRSNIELRHHHIHLRVRSGSSIEGRRAVLQEWYRMQLKEAVPAVIERCRRAMHIQINGFFVQAMKTKWGSCNDISRTIRLNTELAKKPRECLEYIIVHEMAHLIEPTHNDHFIVLMDRFLPNWRHCREELNRLPVRHESWGY